MVDDDVEILDVEQIEKAEEKETSRRSRLALALILLLLLLLCVITTVADVYTSAPDTSRVQAVIRNIECLQCHVELIPEFGKTAVHNPFETKSCTVCHTPHGVIVRTTERQGPVERWGRFRTLIEWLPLRIACQVGAGPGVTTSGGGTKTVSSVQAKDKTSHLTQPLPDLCWTCHADIAPQMGLAYQHRPFEAGSCLSCHDPHASDFKKLIPVPKRDLCVMCHRIVDDMALADKHRPFAERDCTACHHPHASDNRGILVKRQRALCFSCHPDIEWLTNRNVQHNPFQNSDCTVCHRPHTSAYTPLLVLNQPPLCYECHPAVRFDFLKPSHHPVGTVKLNCGDCHNPHAANYPGLLDAEDNSFCYKCHADPIKVYYPSSRHRVLLCIRCHTPHGSDYWPLLRNSNPELCLECHEPKYYDESSKTVRRNNHPVRPFHHDVAANRPLTCTSTCHNPHGSPWRPMLRTWLMPTDGGCLQCHGVVKGDKVGVDY